MTAAPARIVLALAVLASVLAGSAGTAAASGRWSEKNPPPLCSTSATADCIRQPMPFISASTAQPIRVDMPIMTRVPSEQAGSATWQVTFSIHTAVPTAGAVMRAPAWASTMQLVPIPGRSDARAGIVFLARTGSCDGAIACTFTTSQSGLYGGWYRAGYGAQGLVAQTACPVSSGNGDFACADTFSESAAYVPSGDDLLPPKLAMRVAGRGLTTKAVAVARDPYGKAMSLTWDFGDGTTAAGVFGRVIAHRYARPAEYEVTARVRTSDGRFNAVSEEAGVLPPRPVLQAVGRSGGTVVAAGKLSGWPSGVDAAVLYWTTGCPADPAAAINSAAYLAFPQPVHADGTVSAQGTPDPAANAFVLSVKGYLRFGGQAVPVSRSSACVTSVRGLSTTTAPVAAGDTTVPVTAPGVLTGDVAVVEAGAVAAEQRTVQGAGLLLATALSSGHPQGVYVLDAGRPVPPYVVPPPPANPPVPVIPGPPGAPTISKVKVISKTAVKLAVRRGATNGHTITGYLAVCGSRDGGKTRSAAGRVSPLTVRKLTRKKHYTCRVRARNSLGWGPYSAPTRRFRA